METSAYSQWEGIENLATGVVNSVKMLFKVKICSLVVIAVDGENVVQGKNFVRLLLLLLMVKMLSKVKIVFGC